MPGKRYYMPPEWAPHKLTLMAWPDNRETWPGIRLNRAEHVYADILEALTPHEEVMLLVANEEARQAAASLLQNRNIDWNRVRLIHMPVNDVWIRDYGPISLLPYDKAKSTGRSNSGSSLSAESRGGPDVTAMPGLTGKQTGEQAGRQTGEQAGKQTGEQGSQAVSDTGGAGAGAPEVVLCDWEYNAWGGKYPPYDFDNAVPGKLARLLNLPTVAPGMVLEGGSIDVNGAGCLLTTESVLLNPNRNPGLGKAEIEENLRTWFGIEKVIWLKSGLRGDDTDGHIDDLARFVSERVIFTTVTDDTSDPNYETLLENWNILKDATDIHGNPFEIVELPLPQTRITGTTVDGSDYVPASYANFYIANRCVLVPTYDKRYDDEVLRMFQSVFPDRYIKDVPCNDLVWGQGSIHCVTQQVIG
ncbi:agmatine deiminase family protein [Balneolales bacterium ANBcel1]|nr:agmatine deiminase family protein [Balneolales bacterium ANBcel1]